MVVDFDSPFPLSAEESRAGALSLSLIHILRPRAGLIGQARTFPLFFPFPCNAKRRRATSSSPFFLPLWSSPPSRAGEPAVLFLPFFSQWKVSSSFPRPTRCRRPGLGSPVSFFFWFLTNQNWGAPFLPLRLFLFVWGSRRAHVPRQFSPFFSLLARGRDKGTNGRVLFFQRPVPPPSTDLFLFSLFPFPCTTEIGLPPVSFKNSSRRGICAFLPSSGRKRPRFPPWPFPTLQGDGEPPPSFFFFGQKTTTSLLSSRFNFLPGCATFIDPPFFFLFEELNGAPNPLSSTVTRRGKEEPP